MTDYIIDMTSSCRPCMGRGVIRYGDVWEACDHCGGSGRESVRLGPKSKADNEPAEEAI